MAESILANNLGTRILLDKTFAVKYKQKKPTQNFFKKMQKIQFLTHFTYFWQNIIFLKIPFLPVFLILSTIVVNFKKEIN